MSRSVARTRLTAVRADDPPRRREDVLAVEEPLEIRVGGRRFSVTMRTPGDDFDLVAGFLVSEGVLTESEQLAAMRYCASGSGPGENTYNVVDASVRGGREAVLLERERSVYTTSSCGVCGLASLEAVATDSAWSVAEDDLRVERELLVSLPDRLREAQAVFERTGGVHAAGLFDADGSLLVLREDVGRHNAVDKVVGWGLREGRLPLRGTLLQVSGRASFELVQKAVMAGIPLLAAVGAPSSLAVDLARDSGLTLIGFSRGSGFNLYAGDARLLP
ncbi:formate dehydrogenase accessory sulfurtransferase FdhD [Rathayibacter sp. AY1E8]|jgi:FdhD protein|uniref:formate dehydrogenase accessory sulfurtransferase FdhD n=1 Tax=unclassified Rathayibacter TaxID=2609250 RepID=UPI000CE8AF9C|nr:MULTISPECIES: formate dehydrogenase accessory sulfurtransferase FdhD [unclassified Rathayibacter]PPF32268.1 formate dehydrogenase accessory sulfurtransferase FdhD [Rathayibacter sp. AY1A2]PPF42324.1 formate dehydrogenase accessory sulfurtransferase FdhD [Rathayibacter sp. AY1A1]PPG11715.1 formate dehydrogenase accessory sulfurtransferase FdhD [Rathayibacter sp. AY1C6]PPG12761.1 formate dehydrogenase accessory sulfurtransferase FdhD [Rathayibacter sp. AY1E8]PPG80686.1 formate dehydrogenase a